MEQLEALRVSLVDDGLEPSVPGSIELDAVDWLAKWKSEQIGDGSEADESLDSAAFLKGVMERHRNAASVKPAPKLDETQVASTSTSML